MLRSPGEAVAGRQRQFQIGQNLLVPSAGTPGVDESPLRSGPEMLDPLCWSRSRRKALELRVVSGKNSNVRLGADDFLDRIGKLGHLLRQGEFERLLARNTLAAVVVCHVWSGTCCPQRLAMSAACT